MLPMQTMGNRIQARREALGLSQTSLADKMGVSRQAVSQWESDVRRPASQKMGELAALLAVPADWLWTGREQPDGAVKLSPKALIATERPIPEVEYAGERPRSTVRDLPVYGSAEGGDGVMVLDNDPIEYIERPPELVGVKGAHAVYVRNDSMYPAYEPGDKVLINPGKPVIAGKDALFTRQDASGTQHAMIKRLVKETSKSWRVQQFNPNRTFEIPKATWQSARRIVGVLRAD